MLILVNRDGIDAVPNNGAFARHEVLDVTHRVRAPGNPLGVVDLVADILLNVVRKHLEGLAEMRQAVLARGRKRVRPGRLAARDQVSDDDAADRGVRQAVTVVSGYMSASP